MSMKSARPAEGLRRIRKRPSVEIYSAERKAELLLANAVDEQDYRAAALEADRLGLHPTKARRKLRKR